MLDIEKLNIEVKNFTMLWEDFPEKEDTVCLGLHEDCRDYINCENCPHFEFELNKRNIEVIYRSHYNVYSLEDLYSNLNKLLNEHKSENVYFYYNICNDYEIIIYKYTHISDNSLLKSLDDTNNLKEYESIDVGNGMAKLVEKKEIAKDNIEVIKEYKIAYDNLIKTCKNCYNIKHCVRFETEAVDCDSFRLKESKENSTTLTETQQKISEKQENYDIIDKPKHYNIGIETTDYIESWDMTFLEGNVIKYVTRYKYKNGLEDLKKAEWYLKRLIKAQTKE